MSGGIQRGRQGGKTVEMAAEISRRSGLRIETVLDLLTRGWSYQEFDREPNRWTHDRNLIEAPVEQHQHITIAPTPNVYGMGGSVNAAVAARLAYDQRPGNDTARTWLATEDRLSAEQYTEYQQLYGRARVQL
jgi:hypothetical protein